MEILLPDARGRFIRTLGTALVSRWTRRILGMYTNHWKVRREKQPSSIRSGPINVTP